MADVGDEFRPGRRYAVSAAALVLLLALEREQNPAQQRRPLERGDVGRSLLEVEGGGVQAEHRRHLCARDPPPTDVLSRKPFAYSSSRISAKVEAIRSSPPSTTWVAVFPRVRETRQVARRSVKVQVFGGGGFCPHVLQVLAHSGVWQHRNVV